MKKIKLIVIFIFSFFLGAEAQPKLEGYEYWFNGIYSDKQVVATTPASQHQLELDIDASALPDGVNVLNIRYKDENSLYSSTLSKVFYKNTETLVLNKNLQSYELWFNSDFENKHVVAITPATEHQLVTNIDVSYLPDGVNVLHTRYKDENGLYSSTLSKVFYINTEILVPDKKLTMYEFWFNSDYENKQKFAITPSTQHQLVTNLDASALPDGVNVLNIRYKDANNRYSSTLSKLFFKSGSVFANNKITACRYWFDNDFENAVYTMLETPVEEYSFTDDLDVSGLPMGEHTMHFQFLDSYGMWSVVTTDSISKTAIPLAAFSVSNSNLCSGSAVQFVNESIDTDTWLWDFGDGNTSTDFEPEHVFTGAGDFDVSLTATDSESGIEDIISQTITINPAYTTKESVEICEGEAYTWNGLDYSTTGIYEETLTSVSGCDSMVTLNLTVHPTYTIGTAGMDYRLVDDDFEEDVLNTFPDDWIIRYAGTGSNDHYIVDDPVKNGVHALKVSGSGWAANFSKPVENIPDKVVLESWIRVENVISGGRCGLGIGNPDVGSWGAYWGRVEFFEGNLITFYYTGNSGGYGTQYILQPATSGTWYHIKIEADAAAATYKVYINGEQSSSTSGGQTITEFPLYSGIQATSVEIYGNSLVYFDDIRMYESGNPPVTICASETPYIFGTQKLTESGNYTETFQTVYGCDSIVTLNLVVNPEYNHTDEISICEGETYKFGTQTFSEAGEYTTVFQSATGCDSTVVLTLTVHPVFNETREATVYADDLPVVFGSQTLTEAGTYTETFRSVNGCDSTVTFTLTVSPSDVTPPLLAINPITISLNSSGQYTLSATDIQQLTEGTSDDDTPYADLLFTAVPDNFSCTTAGTAVPVTITATDLQGNSSSATTTVKVTDQTPPEIICRNVNLQLDENGQATINKSRLYTAADACGIASVTAEKTRFGCSDAGTLKIRVTATDMHSNTNTCTATVTVSDLLSPLITPVETLVVSLEEGSCETTVEYPALLASDNCNITDVYQIEGLGPDATFPAGISTERWVAVDESGNSDTLSFDIQVVDNPAAPSMNSVAEIELEEDDTDFTFLLEGLSDGSPCLDYPLSFVLTPDSSDLLLSAEFSYKSGENTATVHLVPVQDAAGETASVITVTNTETGKQYSDTFNIRILPVNDPPLVVQPPGNLEIQTGEVFKKYISPYTGHLFYDVDDDHMQLTITAADGENLPGWLTFSNDTLEANPTDSDAGCINLMLTASDTTGAQTVAPFMLCVSPALGADELTNGIISVYPNPTSGIVYINFSVVSGNKINVSIIDILGKEILRKNYPAERQIEVDLSDKVSGIYFLKLRTDDGVELTSKIIVNTKN